MRDKASAQHASATRRSPYANSPTTNRAIKKIIKKTPVKKETIPSVLISLFLARFLIGSISVQVIHQPFHHLVISSFKARVDHAPYFGSIHRRFLLIRLCLSFFFRRVFFRCHRLTSSSKEIGPLHDYLKP